MNYLFKLLALFVLSFFVYSCSPLKSSPKEEKHQMELTLHEVQTNLDDMRHDLNCYQTELQILDGKIKNQENSLTSLKQQNLERLQNKTETILKQINTLEQKLTSNEKKHTHANSDITQLSSHANETTAALSQYKDRMNELERAIYSQNKKLDEVAKLKTTLEAIAKSMKENSNDALSYKVKAGDSLEKIARSNKVSVDSLKKINNLDNDLIVVGQELKIPK